MARSTPRPITEVTAIDVHIETYLRAAGGVFRTFPHQDSGTTSYGVFADGDRWFVKPSTDPSIVESLRRALRLNSVVNIPHCRASKTRCRSPAAWRWSTRGRPERC